MARWLIRFYENSVCRINLHWRCGPTSRVGSRVQLQINFGEQKFKVSLTFVVIYDSSSCTEGKY